VKKIEPKKINKEGGGRRFITEDAEKIGNKNEQKKLLIRSAGRIRRCQSGSFKLKMKLTLPMAAKKKERSLTSTQIK
jgi:hypothetical protein